MNMPPDCQILHAPAHRSGLPDYSAHAVVTSPPFWAQRDGSEPADWPETRYAPMPGMPPITVPAMRCCLGREDDPEQWVGHVVQVFREIKRVLRDDGVAFVSVGDTFAMVARGAGGKGKQHSNKGSVLADRRTKVPPWLKVKDCIGLPWRVGFALQADGWFWRGTAPWLKRCALPSPVKDRPGCSTEYWLMFTKGSTYFYDADAVRLDTRNRRDSDAWFDSLRLLQLDNGPVGFVPDAEGLPLAFDVANNGNGTGHDSAYPVRLVEPLIRAATSDGGVCVRCGMPYERAGATGWRQACRCPEKDRFPATVYDPFMGSGTTAIAALGLGRRFVGTDVSGECVKLARERVCSWRSPAGVVVKAVGRRRGNGAVRPAKLAGTEVGA